MLLFFITKKEQENRKIGKSLEQDNNLNVSLTFLDS